MTETREGFAGWAILELMGHRRLGGHVSEQEIAGTAFIRVDVPGYVHTEPTGEQEEREAATQFYSPGAVYCITPTSEEIARRVAEGNRPTPVSDWEIRRALPPAFVPEVDEEYEPELDEDGEREPAQHAELDPDAIPF